MDVFNVKEFEALSPLFRGERGHRLAKLVMRIYAVDKVNRLINRSANYTEACFAASILNDLGINYAIGNAERLKHLPEGAFITVSNHPYGGLDGIMLIDLISGLRPDYKFIVNKILALITMMSNTFIPVTPKGNKEKGIDAVSLRGIRKAMTCLKKGSPVGFFPSGAVSDFSIRELRVRDREWQNSILNLIKSAKVPILPIRFFDKNSLFFYFLGVINWRIRLIRMPRELFNKRGRVHRIGIGNLISVEKQEQFPDGRSLGIFLRETVYEMPLPTSYTPRSIISVPDRAKDA